MKGGTHGEVRVGRMIEANGEEEEVGWEVQEEKWQELEVMVVVP